MIVAAAPPAAAAMVLNSGIGNAALSGYAGPFATVTISLVDATHAQITYASNTVAGNIYLFGDGGMVALNFNGVVAFPAAVTATNAAAGFTPGPFSDGGTVNQDGFGKFNFSINDFDGYTHTADYVRTALRRYRNRPPCCSWVLAGPRWSGRSPAQTPQVTLSKVLWDHSRAGALRSGPRRFLGVKSLQIDHLTRCRIPRQFSSPRSPLLPAWIESCKRFWN